MNNSLQPLEKSLPIASNLLPEGAEDLYDIQTNGKKKSYVCRIPECGKLFRYKSEIHRHIATHSNHRPHTCPYDSCKKSFKRGDALDNHLRTHTKETPFFCKVDNCGKTFITKASLRYHILKHNNRKVYRCNYSGCNKAFITVFQLKQHEKSTCVHKKLLNDSHSTFYQPKPENIPLVKAPSFVETKKEIVPPPFFGGLPIGNSMISPFQRPQEQISRVADDKIMNIITENELLKRKLEFSQKVINLLQQNIQMKNVNIPEYPTPDLVKESLMRFQYYQNSEN